jgi:hypothetical protein
MDYVGDLTMQLMYFQLNAIQFNIFNPHYMCGTEYVNLSFLFYSIGFLANMSEKQIYIT